MIYDPVRHSSQIHDAHLVGMNLENMNVLVLNLTAFDGQKFVIRLDGLIDLGVRGFWLQNIVDQIEVKAVNDTECRDILFELEKLSCRPTVKQNEAIIRDALREGGLVYFYLTPFNGCEIAAICRLVSLDE